MRIGITGASGFIGKYLTEYLTGLNHYVIPIGRGLLQEEVFQHLVEALEDCDVVINLAGATVNRRWTSKYKEEMFNSRIGITSRLICALKSAKVKPKLMISASAVGYYPSNGEYDEHDEVVADGYLASLCRNWEAAALKCPPDIRLVIVRLGVVLAIDGGAMQQMITPLVRTKISAVIGSGKQLFPWIAVQDVCAAIAFLTEHDEMEGVYNLVSPQRISQKYLAGALAKAYWAWLTLPVPGILFKCLLGERSSMLLEGQNVRPSRLLDAGFKFTVPTIKRALSLPDG